MIETTGRVYRSLQILVAGGSDNDSGGNPFLQLVKSNNLALEWAVPTGAVKMGTTVKIAFLD